MQCNDWMNVFSFLFLPSPFLCFSVSVLQNTEGMIVLLMIRGSREMGLIVGNGRLEKSRDLDMARPGRLVFVHRPTHVIPQGHLCYEDHLSSLTGPDERGFSLKWPEKLSACVIHLLPRSDVNYKAWDRNFRMSLIGRVTGVRVNSIHLIELVLCVVAYHANQREILDFSSRVVIESQDSGGVTYLSKPIVISDQAFLRFYIIFSEGETAQSLGQKPGATRGRVTPCFLSYSTEENLFVLINEAFRRNVSIMCMSKLDTPHSVDLNPLQTLCLQSFDYY